MMRDPLFLILILIAVESLVLGLSANHKTKHLFKILPSMFWIYFLPMVLSTCGVIDARHPVYQEITKYLLPPALFLMLIDMDIESIVRLGPSALIMFFSGTLGILFGMVVSFIIFKPFIGTLFWGGFGALAASWTGGSANMIAVKEALNTPENVFLPMVIVDTILPYTWLGIVIFCAGRQKDFDAWNHSDRRILDDLAKQGAGSDKNKENKPQAPVILFVSILLAFLVSLVARRVAVFFPTGKAVLSPSAWTIILVTASAIILSMTPIKQVASSRTHLAGKWILYLVLASIGARASLSNASQVGILLLAGVVVIAVHVLVLLIVARLIRAPLFLAATASLSNIAGLVSAPVVAEIYQPGLASVGLLLAILGHSIGVYNGILTGHICRLFMT
ncbi:MAG: DUF819 family protein [Candidatus Omnitrophica bacterium]|nr:DUF819 family protein [Candidatus Omnitrophota bacterium]